MTVNTERIAGYCPMGCGQTLFVADGGYVTCSYVHCPEPTAVADILEDRETEHLVDLGENNFSVWHPLRERLHGDLLTCDLHDYLSGLDGPPRLPGWYRARKLDGQWLFIAAAPPSARTAAPDEATEDTHSDGYPATD